MVLITLCVVGSVAAVSSGIAMIRACHGKKDYFRSEVLKKGAMTDGYLPESLRTRFADEVMVEVKASQLHTHGTSAASRSTGTLFIEQFGKGLGRNVLFYQCSRSDQRNGRHGSRSYYWAKDLTAAPAVFKPARGDLLAMVDVDQYVDIPEFCVDNFQPLILYTFQPGKVARVGEDYSYTFNHLDEVVYKVSGGATYQHKVWNYSSDCVVFSKTFFGIPYRTATYLVDKRGVDSDHQLILLTPLCRWSWIYALLARFLQGHPLHRLSVAQGPFTRLQRHDKTGVNVSTGRVMEYLSSETSAAVDSSLASIARTSKVGLTLPQVKCKVEDVDAAAILYEYHLTTEKSYATHIFPVEKFVRTYQFDPMQHDPEAKPSLVSFMKPIVDGAFAPALSLTNAKAAVAGRLERVRGKATMDPFLMKCVSEFVELFYESAAHTLVPCEYDEVYSRQDRPTQRRILHEAEFMEPRRVAKSFQKREAYGKCSYPRIITTIDGNDKMNYSRFTYALADFLKCKEWYAFSKTPFEIAVRVCEILRYATMAGNTDLSKMDGHVCEVLRYLDREIMLMGFQPQYCNEIVELLRSQYGLVGYMAVAKSDEVVQYNQELSQASGSPDTSAFNTIRNAFMAFLTFRMTKEGGRFIQARDAYSRLGMYGGDDGLTANVSPTMYVKAAARCGQELTFEGIERGNLGIKFLSRNYGPEVWYGDPNSCCDLPRALSKFHTCVNMPPGVTDVQKMFEKAFAYWLTDENTPIMGDFVCMVVELGVRANMSFTNMHGVWNARYSKSVQYPNDYRDWYDDYCVESLPEFDIRKFRRWVESCQGLLTALSPPLCMERIQPSVVEPTVVDGDIALPAKVTEKTVAKRKRVRRPRASRDNRERKKMN